MEIIRFVVWETAKVLALAWLAILAGKAVWALAGRMSWLRGVLFALILAAVGAGTWWAAHDVAAEVYWWRSEGNLQQGNLLPAYADAHRAVGLRPRNRVYWRALIQAKLALQQVRSALDDEPALRALGGGELADVDEFQFARCDYLLGHYDKVVATTLRLIRHNPAYPGPYVLQGLTYTAEKKYPEAQQSFIALLELFPSNQAAVEGLARAYYLGGDRQRAMGLLDETVKYPFPPAVRQRFLALKELYAQ